jgi:hypothetical protein
MRWSSNLPNIMDLMSLAPANRNNDCRLTMKIQSMWVVILVAVTTGVFAILAFGYGAFGAFIALSSKGGGFVGEEGFYASALFFLGLIMMAAGGAAGIISYLCWTRLNRGGT